MFALFARIGFSRFNRRCNKCNTESVVRIFSPINDYILRFGIKAKRLHNDSNDIIHKTRSRNDFFSGSPGGGFGLRAEWGYEGVDFESRKFPILIKLSNLA